MLRPRADRLAVWGDPVAHSRSPQLHAAAYHRLKLPWSYERRRVSERGFTAALAELSDQWRGLSLTMPLKAVAFQAAISHDRGAELTGAVNTLVLTEEGPRGFNTDIGGIVRALSDEGIEAVGAARVIGAGATATSAVAALGELGAERVEVVARRREAAEPLVELGGMLGIHVTVLPFDHPVYAAVPISIATLPGDARVADGAAEALAAQGGLLMDAVYGQWPTALARAWERAGQPAVSGMGMLVHQALLQVRTFAGGDPNVALPDEAAVLAEMAEAVMGD